MANLGTANQYIDAAGRSLFTQPQDVIQQYMIPAGYDQLVAGTAWAARSNADLISRGEAISTSVGVLMDADVLRQLQQNGYTGATDAASLASAFAMLHTATPAALPATPSAAVPIGGFSLPSLSSIPKPAIYAGLAFLAYEMFFKGGRR